MTAGRPPPPPPRPRAASIRREEPAPETPDDIPPGDWRRAANALANAHLALSHTLPRIDARLESIEARLAVLSIERDECTREKSVSRVDLEKELEDFRASESIRADKRTALRIGNVVIGSVKIGWKAVVGAVAIAAVASFGTFLVHDCLPHVTAPVHAP